MTRLETGGPPRYDHQRLGLNRMIATGGVTALLFDPGMGKGLALDTEVPTPFGWTTMGDLSTGDQVIDSDGRATRVVAHEPYRARCWELTFSDGTVVVADEDHLWVTDDRNARRRAAYNGRPVEQEVRDTRTVVATLRRDSEGGANHRVALTAPATFNVRSEGLLLDPYLLGYWLGDGSSGSGVLSVGEADVEHVLAQFPTLRVTRTVRGVSYLSSGRSWPTFGSVLRDLGVLGDKHVPRPYMRASAGVRLDVLRGLMDSDGNTSSQRTVEFSTTRERLARDVQELAASLGERVSFKQTTATLDGREVGPRWRVRWTPQRFDPFRMQRKSTPPRKGRIEGRYIVAARDVGEQSVRCLTVDSPTAQYLVTRSWLPTHNTAVVIDYASLLALKLPGGEARILVVCPLVAVDTWVMQTEQFISPAVSYWAEAVGGSLLQRAATLASRGGNLLTKPPFSAVQKVGEHPRALNHQYSWAWATSNGIEPRQGPSALAVPRVVLEVINIDTLTSRTPVGRQTMADVMVDAIRRYDPHLLVVDESHKIKGAQGNASRLLARVAKFVPRRVLLTGTVMPTSPLDVFAQWRFLDPLAFGTPQPDGTTRPATYGSFKDRFAVLGGWMGKEVTGFKNLDEMQTIMARNAVVARKKDALDLPATTDVTLPVDLTAKEKKAYAEMKTQLATQLAAGVMASTSNRLTQMMRLRQITSGHLPDDRGQVQVIGTSKARTIASLVNDTLAGEKRVVVFALFTREIEVLRTVLAEPGTEVMVITGQTSGEDRMAMRRRFGSDDPSRIVMIAQIKTMSLAVNELVTANHAVFASLSQQRDDYVQARDRLDRIGQTRPVTFWHAVAPGTVDEVILRSHRDRTDLEAAMLRHIQDSV